MATLEEQLKADPASRVDVRLAVNPVALRDAFGELKPSYWNPPADRFAYGRAARTFLPADQGGADASEPSGRLFDLYMLDQIPAAVFAPPQELKGNEEASTRIRRSVGNVYGVAFLEPPNPRERIQRGQFHDAARDLVAKQDYFNQGLERLRNNRDGEEQLRAWTAEAQKLYERLGLARADRDREAEQAALAAVEEHWRANAPVVQFLVDRVVALVGQAEATMLLAMCKHEEAEQAQARLESAGKGDDTAALKKAATAAWVAAAAQWRSYEERSGVHRGYPGRAEHTRALAARAQKLAGQK
jgi:hypothetical protein